MPTIDFDPRSLIVPRREITGITAVLLPFDSTSQIDWPAFEQLIERTATAGLTPAVNMDTGYVHLLDGLQRLKVLEVTKAILDGKPFVAGAFLGDAPGDNFDPDAYARQIDWIQSNGGTPVIFQSYGLTEQTDDQIVESYRQIASTTEKFIAFELGKMFAPFGSIYSIDVYRELMGIPQCLGAKHSSLQRDLEWQRLALRNEVRPDFKVFTGNDLAIDMIIYGSDYLLGLSCFAPDAFAKRDAMWLSGDAGWNQLNDVLQYLGFLAFRNPTPAYKHSAAMFLHQRGWLKSDATHPNSPTRPESDRELMKNAAAMLAEYL